MTHRTPRPAGQKRETLQAHANVASLDEARRARRQSDPTECVIFVGFRAAEPEGRTRPIVGRPLSKDAAGYAVALGIQKRARAARNPAPVLVADGPPRHRHLSRGACDAIVRDIAMRKMHPWRWRATRILAWLGLAKR